MRPKPCGKVILTMAPGIVISGCSSIPMTRAGTAYIYKRAKDKAQIRKARGRGMQAWHRKPERCSPNMRAFTQPSTSAQTAAALLCLAAPIANDWPDIRSRHEKGNAP